MGIAPTKPGLPILTYYLSRCDTKSEVRTTIASRNISQGCIKGVGFAGARDKQHADKLHRPGLRPLMTVRRGSLLSGHWGSLANTVIPAQPPLNFI